MSQKIMLTASTRTETGKSANRRLRRTGMVPAIVYGGKEGPVAITLEHRELSKEMKQESFYSQILNLSIDNKNQQVILKDIHRHPFKPAIMHMDLERVSADKLITVHVPIHYLNEANAKGVKTGGGIISHNLIDIEVSCLPAKLPEYIEIDLLNVDLDETIHLSDIKLPEGVTSVALNHKDDKVVASIHVPKAAPVEEDIVADTTAEDTNATNAADGEANTDAKADKQD
jgi:large subunit ribosomal protein L25